MTSLLLLLKRNNLSHILAVFFASLILASPLNAQDFESILWTVDAGPEYTAIGGNYDTLYLQSHQIPKTDVKLPVPGRTITNVKWHPEGNLLAISSQIHKVDGGVMILDIRTMHTYKLKSVATTGARAIAWSPSGKLLAVGDNEGDLHIFDQSFALVKKVDTGLRSITSLSWHPDESVITMVSGRIGNYNLETEQMQLWDSRKEEILLLSVAWYPSGDFFALADYGDNYKNYPAQLQFHKPDGSLIKVMQGSKAEYRNIQWTADGEYLATVSDAFRIWNNAGELISTLPFEHLLWGLSFDELNQQWVITDEVGQVHRVSSEGKQLLSTIRPLKNNAQ